jgi:crotonobetainyl-CoA:carnitine CoA-transferase CaiB-like acyl-CoA transferase
MDRPAWADQPKFDSTLGRWENRHQLDEYLGRWTAPQDDRELMEKLQHQGISAGAVFTARDLVEDPHLNARGFFNDFDNPRCPRVGPRKYAGRPFRVPGIPMAITSAASLGEHNDGILREVAALSTAEIDALARSGVIATAPRPEEPRP